MFGPALRKRLARRHPTPLLVGIEVCDFGVSRSEFLDKFTIARKSSFIPQYMC
ncbi:hypothetical protein GGE50_000763 [Rhizobium leguminosarum]|nr:hypothetical protein RLV_5349 [Rhizobium leguminosarum bv. viciae]MBB4326260.1 hypothetical protein [Rhizobium leguminosarum]MBB4339381.1 hypothetical protein [Rhizobium leguminosarum]MBB4352450.1 hypothetical protein [Rhizobium leguminosarum]MBB4384666.1 hypothetical protein [Rhizobium leguminosarum]